MAKLNLIQRQNQNDGEEISVKNQITILNSSDPGKPKSAEIILMQSGWNANGIYFSKEKIKELPDKVMAKKKLYMNHDLFGFGSRDVDSWLGTFTSCEYFEESGVGYLKGKMDFTNNPNTIWIYDEIARDPEEVHFSTHLLGYFEEGEIEGRKGKIVSNWAAYLSTDCVSYGAAGGKALKVMNSLGLLGTENLDILQALISNNKSEGEEKMDIKTIADLTANYPHLVQSLTNSIEAELNKKNDLANKEAELTNLRNSKVEFTNKITSLEGEKTKLTEKITALEGEKVQLANENATLKTKVDAFETKEKAANWLKEIQNAIKEAELDEKFVTEQFLSDLQKFDKIEHVKNSILDRKALVNDSPVIGTGGSGSQSKSNEKKVISDEDLVNSLNS